ncbi:hypothetical protein KP509_31G036300 [Ceratopteris richardii]|uniref:Uncharacterized protein n=1 Tax=Ceratopteris richardii TaxID=49495 RepID=A0A8T2QZB7_CERRI|nr:hypothetical protein KP509_31G036300 [Ceratopteris richardii]
MAVVMKARALATMKVMVCLALYIMVVCALRSSLCAYGRAIDSVRIPERGWHRHLQDLGHLQECRCQHCPCLYDNDEKCHLCFECDQTTTNTHKPGGSGSFGPMAAEAFGADESSNYSRSAPSAERQYDGADLGQPCCSTNSCCYFQF